jgi:hypothetical protein
MSAIPKEIDPASSLITEAWSANNAAVELFESQGWQWAGIDYHRMWLNGSVPKEQADGGTAETTVFAVFDAGQG